MSNRISPEHMAEIKAMTRGVLPSQLLEHISSLEAENERLRHDAEQWRKHEYGVARACEQGIADLARLAALDEEVGGE